MDDWWIKIDDVMMDDGCMMGDGWWMMGAMGMMIMIKMMMIVIIVNDHNDNEYECEYETCHLLLARFIVMQAPSIEVLKRLGPCLWPTLLTHLLKVESYIMDRRAPLPRRMGLVVIYHHSPKPSGLLTMNLKVGNVPLTSEWVSGRWRFGRESAMVSLQGSKDWFLWQWILLRIFPLRFIKDEDMIF